MIIGEMYAIYDPLYQSSCYIGTYESTSYHFVTFKDVHFGKIFYKKLHFPKERIFIKIS
jgi:hypothetical protein